jgi:histidine triad (HIT) family protein
VKNKEPVMADCIFCQIAAGKIPGDIVFQDESVLAFKDIHPKAPVHVLIIPRKHIISLADLRREDLPVAVHMLEVVNTVAQNLGTGKAYKLVVNTGSEAGQVIMHLHMHLLGGRKINALV